MARVREAPTASRTLVAYREALKEYTREHMPFQCAMTQNHLGNTLLTLAEAEREGGTNRLEEAIIAYREALEEYTGERASLLRWAMITGKQGQALILLAERTGDSNRALTAVHQTTLAVATMREAYDIAAAAYFETLLGGCRLT
jgi:hypothetical protein